MKRSGIDDELELWTVYLPDNTPVVVDRNIAPELRQDLLGRFWLVSPRCFTELRNLMRPQSLTPQEATEVS